MLYRLAVVWKPQVRTRWREEGQIQEYADYDGPPRAILVEARSDLSTANDLDRCRAVHTSAASTTFSHAFEGWRREELPG